MGEKPSLVFVDDEPYFQFIYGGTLQRRLGWKVHCASNPEEALELVEEVRPDAISIDRMMPRPEGGSPIAEVGDELLHTVRAKWPNLCAVVLTVNYSIEAAQEATRSGAYRYLVKEATPDDLDRTLRNGIRQRLVHSAKPLLLSHPDLTGFLGELETLIDRTLALRGGSQTTFPDGLYECQLYFTGPGGSLMKQGIGLARNRSLSREFVHENRDRIAQVIESCQPLLTLDSGVSLGSQLLIPVRSPQAIGDTSSADVAAILELRCPAEIAFDLEDRDIFCEVADMMTCAVAKEHQLTAHSANVAEEHRNATVHMINHRVRTPLASAKMRAEQIAKQVPEAKEVVAELSTVIERLNRFTSPVSNVQGPQEFATLRSIIENAVKQATGSGDDIQTPIEQELEGLEEDCGVIADVSQLTYAMSCIVTNALESVAEKRRKLGDAFEDGEVRIVGRVDPFATGTAAISIIDNGIGFGPGIVARVFDLYFSTKSADHQERGIGLFETKQIIKRCGGQIEALNATCGGAEFCIQLPTINAPEGIENVESNFRSSGR